MDRSSLVAQSALRFNCPCGETRARELVGRLRRDHARALDLGCGWGELLLDLVEASPGATGLGVERRAAYVSRGRQHAVVRGLAGRVHFVEGDAAAHNDPADVVIAVGASEALGGAEVFARLRARMAPGATLLFADATWTGEASAELRATLGELPDAEAHEAEAARAGLRAMYRSLSTAEEWDTFEAAWRAPFEQSAEAEARAFAAARRDLYVNGYRGVMGFAWWIFTAA